jgi:hypothetical protein
MALTDTEAGFVFSIFFFLVFSNKDRLSNMADERERAALSVRYGREERQQQCSLSSFDCDDRTKLEAVCFS